MKWSVLKFALLIYIASLSAFAIDFPQTHIKKENPFNGVQYEHIKIGPIKHIKRFGKNYLVRYVTVYNKKTVDEPIENIPRFEENCHDQGDRVASWSFTRSYSRSVESGVSLNLLGMVDIQLGADISRSFDISITRWIQTQLGVQALHTAILTSEKLEGMSYKQIYYIKSGEVVNEPLVNDQFVVDRINPIFRVVREITGDCP